MHIPHSFIPNRIKQAFNTSCMKLGFERKISCCVLLFWVPRLYLPSLSNIWILASGAAQHKLGCGSASSEIYGTGLLHSAMFEMVLPCAVPLRSPCSPLPGFPAFSLASGSLRKKNCLPPFFPLCFCHQWGTIKISRSCSCSDTGECWFEAKRPCLLYLSDL